MFSFRLLQPLLGAVLNPAGDTGHEFWVVLFFFNGCSFPLTAPFPCARRGVGVTQWIPGFYVLSPVGWQPIFLLVRVYNLGHFLDLLLRLWLCWHEESQMTREHSISSLFHTILLWLNRSFCGPQAEQIKPEILHKSFRWICESTPSQLLLFQLHLFWQWERQY